MNLDELTASGRSWAEALLSDTCTVGTSTPGTLNTATGRYGAASTAAVYSGKCRVKPTPPTEIVAGEIQAEHDPYTVDLPRSATGIRRGMVLTVTDSQDPDLVDLTMTVVGVTTGTHVLRRRLLCEVTR